MAPRGWMMALLALMAVLLVASPSSVSAAETATETKTKKSHVIELTSDNFDHLTQAASGATTGDWLVEFYAPWCGHCQRLAPIYENVASELKGKVNVAKIDASEHTDLSKRFKMTGFPTILLMRQGQMYKFSGKRGAQELAQFATGGYKTVTSAPVPAKESFITAINDHLTVIYDDFVVLLATKKNVLLATFSGGLFFGVLLGWLCSCCTSSRSGSASAGGAKKPKTN